MISCSTKGLRALVCWPLSPCATHFDVMPCLLSSGILFMCSLIFAYPAFLGPPLSLLFPCIFTIPLMETCPYHLSHFCLTKVIIGSMLASLQMSSFLTWSFLVFGVESCFIKLCTHASTCSCGVNFACSCQFQFGFREWFICVIYYHINFRMPPMMVLKHVLLHRVLDSYS